MTTRLLFSLLLSIGLFIYMAHVENANGMSNPVGMALQHWVSMVPVLAVPLTFNVNLWKRMLLFLIVSVPAVATGAAWANYSDYGNFIFVYYAIVIFICIVISHFMLRTLERIDPTVARYIILGSLIVTAYFGYVEIREGIEKYDGLVQRFNHACQTRGDIYGNCSKPGYIRFFPPNNHVTY